MLAWNDDYFELAGFKFRLQTETSSNTADDAFVFYKNRSMVQQFARFFSEAGFSPKTILELGIWDGGSAAFWVETLKLSQYVGIDLQARGDSRYYQLWHSQRGDGIAHTEWGISQTDGRALNAIISKYQLEPIDLIIDDCSHQYDATLKSFELLFNRLRPGGYYIIEDWAWALHPEFQRPEHQWAVFPPLHPIIHKILDLHGSRPDLIASVRAFPAFVAVERGAASAHPFVVGDLTVQRPRPPLKLLWYRLRLAASSVRRRVSGLPGGAG